MVAVLEGAIEIVFSIGGQLVPFVTQRQGTVSGTAAVLAHAVVQRLGTRRRPDAPVPPASVVLRRDAARGAVARSGAGVDDDRPRARNDPAGAAAREDDGARQAVGRPGARAEQSGHRRPPRRGCARRTARASARADADAARPRHRRTGAGARGSVARASIEGPRARPR